MKLQKFVEDLIDKGQSDSEIVQKVLSEDSYSSELTSNIVSEILKAKNAQEIKKSLFDAENAKKEKQEFAKKVSEDEQRINDLVDKKLKTINVLSGNFKEKKEKSFFDTKKGQWIDLDSSQSEEFSKFDLLLRCIAKNKWVEIGRAHV